MTLTGALHLLLLLQCRCERCASASARVVATDSPTVCSLKCAYLHDTNTEYCGVLCSSSSEQGAYVGVTAAGEGLSVTLLQWSYTVHDSSTSAATTAADVDSSDAETSIGGAQQASNSQQPGKRRCSVNDTTAGTATAVKSSGGRWEDVHMIYDVAWPLHLVLTRQAMQQYGKLSALLLHVRRCCTE
eukprot:6917-Heterococcus_DN1.PRE.1